MNHAALTQAEGERLYEHRNYVLHLLDKRHFDALNKTRLCRDSHGTLHEAAPAPVLALNGYCLDALDDIPCGGMHSCARLPTQLSMPRGRTLDQHIRGKALARKLVAEILAEIDRTD